MISPNPIVERVQSYAPGEQPEGDGFTKLNTNEFPYPVPEKVADSIHRGATSEIRLYPSPRCQALRRKLAQCHGISTDNIFVGNGSDEILRLLMQGYGGPGRSVAVVEPSYSLFPILAAATGADLQVFSLDDLERLPESVFAGSYDVLLLPVPNPPIGTLFPLDRIERLAHRDALIVLDEAYIDFAGNVGTLALMAKYDNIVISRTFSKAFGLAGLRVGYAMAHPAIISTLSKLGDSYNVNRISQAAAIAALDAEDYYRQCIEQIKSDREWLRDELRRRGFGVLPSYGNFLFARHPKAEEIYLGLKARRILVRHFSSPLLADGVRITIGTHAQLETLLDGIDSLLGISSGIQPAAV